MNYSKNVWRFLVENRHNHNPSGSGRRGTQRVFRFPNGFGASVVKWTMKIDGRPTGGSFGGSYGASDGLYELAVTAYSSEEHSALTYETPVTSDVLGYLTADEVEAHLQDIANLWVV